MTQAERKWHKKDVLSAIVHELKSHIPNGSDWLYRCADEEALEIINYRIQILNSMIESIRKKVSKL